VIYFGSFASNTVLGAIYAHGPYRVLLPLLGLPMMWATFQDFREAHRGYREKIAELVAFQLEHGV
jgi:hypothetical protein